MPSHKYWQALAMTASAPDTLELSEFQLFNGATRVDASATLTANIAPTSGTMANLKDNSTATGAYWATGAATVVLTWVFPSTTNVDGIKLGSRTTSSRYPISLVLQGGDDANGSGPSPEYISRLTFGGIKFTSATLSPITVSSTRGDLEIVQSSFDHYTPGGIGRVPYDIKREVLPATAPKTYVPMWAKVRLERDIDGRVIREQWSDPVTGLGAFEEVDENYTYTVTAIDPAAGLRAVIADRIKPEGYPV